MALKRLTETRPLIRMRRDQCVGGRVLVLYKPSEPWVVRLWGSENSADLGGSSNDSNGIFEDWRGERFHGNSDCPWVSRSWLLGLLWRKLGVCGVCKHTYLPQYKKGKEVNIPLPRHASRIGNERKLGDIGNRPEKSFLFFLTVYMYVSICPTPWKQIDWRYGCGTGKAPQSLRFERVWCSIDDPWKSKGLLVPCHAWSYS